MSHEYYLITVMKEDPYGENIRRTMVISERPSDFLHRNLVRNQDENYKDNIILIFSMATTLSKWLKLFEFNPTFPDYWLLKKEDYAEIKELVSQTN